MTPPNAIDLLQTFLDETSAVTLHDDFDSFQCLIARPCVITTDTGTSVLDNRRKLKIWFDSFVAAARLQRVTEIVRLATTAHQVHDGLIFGTYVSQYLANGQRIMEPFESCLTLLRSADRWVVTSVVTSLRHDQWPILLPEAAPRTRHAA